MTLREIHDRIGSAPLAGADRRRWVWLLAKLLGFPPIGGLTDQDQWTAFLRQKWPEEVIDGICGALATVELNRAGGDTAKLIASSTNTRS